MNSIISPSVSSWNDRQRLCAKRSREQLIPITVIKTWPGIHIFDIFLWLFVVLLKLETFGDFVGILMSFVMQLAELTNLQLPLNFIII